MNENNLDLAKNIELQGEVPIDTLTNLDVTNKLNESIIKYKTPIGRSGPIIGIFPIVLSDFQIDINCELKYKSPIKSIKTLKNNIKLNKLTFLNDSYKLLVEGYLSKHVEILSFNNRFQNNTINIPFRTLVDINYNTYPKFSFDEEHPNKKDFKRIPLFRDTKSTKISWKIEEINLFEKKVRVKHKDETIYKIIISFNIILLQNQKVFIPQPIDYLDPNNSNENNE
ncbi:hypothetical protein [Clostridium massiliamazoniense]|uniref:hypothetical protein n=1 Tax=Clostridium massiliamazoniense TaxID=1347366 RepID=UPI0006D7EF15|nr:hypothetical protein [Clostridium massiliamazoniense]